MALHAVREGCRELKIAPSTLLRWLNDGFVADEQITPGAPAGGTADIGVIARALAEAPAGHTGTTGR